MYLQVDPTLTRADRLVGQVLGEVGALPDVFTELEINFFLLRRLLGVRTEVRVNCPHWTVPVHGSTMSCLGCSFLLLLKTIDRSMWGKRLKAGCVGMNCAACSGSVTWQKAGTGEVAHNTGPACCHVALFEPGKAFMSMHGLNKQLR